MTQTRTCERCGTALAPGGGLRGLCPQCLMQLGMEGTGAGSEPQPVRFTAPDPEELAKELPQYEILGLLGQGGMGAVYKARQRSLDRTIALKILPLAADRDPAFAERFTREAQALASLGHPGIVGVFDFGRAGRHLYLAMEYVEGLNLRQLLRSQEIGSRQALAIVSQVCEALQYAHDQGVVHRDIKPENILVDRQGRVKITDFGLAKLLGATEDVYSLTGTGQVMGTPHYMAPEQVERPREVDHRADIYSLGVVFYELLTGELPLGRFTVPSKKVKVDVRLDEVVLRALEKEPGMRYQHASDVKTDVDDISDGRGPAAERAAWVKKLERSLEDFGDRFESAMEMSIGALDGALSKRQRRWLERHQRRRDRHERRGRRDRARAEAADARERARADAADARERAHAGVKSLRADALARRLLRLAFFLAVVGISMWLTLEIQRRGHDDDNVQPNDLVEYTDGRPTLGRWAIEEFGLSPEQAAAVDESLARLRKQYVEAELEHTDFSWKNDERLRVKIEPFREERNALKVLLWSELTTAMADKTPKSYYLNAIASYVFPYGDRPAELELWRDAGGYRASTRSGHDLPYVFTWSRVGPQPIFRHMWAALRGTPRSADAGLRLVLASLDGLRENGARPQISALKSASLDGKDGEPDYVKVYLDLTIRAEDALAATRAYAEWRADLESRPWCSKASASRVKTLDSEDGLFIDNQEILVIPETVPNGQADEGSVDIQTLIYTLARREHVEPVDVGMSMRTRAGLFVEEQYQIAPSGRSVESFANVLAFSAALEKECPNGVVTRIELDRGGRRGGNDEETVPDEWRWECMVTVHTTPR